MKVKLVVLALLSLCVCCSSSLAGWDKKPQVRVQQLFRFDLRQDDHTLSSTRVTAQFTFRDKANKELFTLTPLFEGRLNTGRSQWEREELGVEIGKHVTPWLYLGNAIQYGWMNEDYQVYGQPVKRTYTESEWRMLLCHKIFSLPLKGFILDEYSYEYDKGRGVRNEVAIGLILPVGRYVETGVNWRHIDRIHFYDSDTVETFMTLVF